MVWYSELFEPPGGERPRYFKQKFRRMAKRYAGQLDHIALFEEAFQNMYIKLQSIETPPVEPYTVELESYVTKIFGRELVEEYRKHYRRSGARKWLKDYGNLGLLAYDLKCRQRWSHTEIRNALKERRLPLDKLDGEPLDEAVLDDILAQKLWATECRENTESVEDMTTGESPEQLMTGEANPEEVADETEDAAKLAIILGNVDLRPGNTPLPLDDHSLAMLRLRFQGGMSVQAIADSFGKERHVVDYNLKKSLKALRVWWGVET